MDFGQLLHVAKKNSENSRNEGKYYCTKFAPPKKESKDKKLSDNIQKFLKKKEREEQERLRIEREKRDKLLALRDDKSKNKIKKMLKVIKSANKSVLEDAVNTEHTAVTMEGPDQPDQDDYGYTSVEANAFYQQYIEKVKNVKEEKNFAPSRPQTRTDLSCTKDRVRAALIRENEEKNNPTRVKASSGSNIEKSTSSSSSKVRASSKPIYDPEAEHIEQEKKKLEEEQKRAKPKKMPPPIMDFQSLLKLAEKKQFEPILVPVETKKEPQRLLTSKEKKELEERQRYLAEREKRRLAERSSAKNKTKMGADERSQQKPNLNEKISTVNQASSLPNKTAQPSSVSSLKSSGVAFKKPYVQGSNNLSQKTSNSSDRVPSKQSLSSPSSSLKPLGNKDKYGHNSTSSTVPSSKTSLSCGHINKPQYKNNEIVRNFPPKDTKIAREKSDVTKTRQFPPSDYGRHCSNKQPDHRKQQVAPKRRIYDDDDESEYDSDLDDFIDDGDAEEDYSSHIKAIFGYDKSKYRDLDLEDDRAMESNYSQVQREEFLSKKIGIMEDLEDMRQEALEKKRKTMQKKRKL